MNRFFIDSGQIADGRLLIGGEDVNHIRNVLRMRPGEDLEAADENGMLLLSGGIDSPVAGWMIAKRGVTIDATYFHEDHIGAIPYVFKEINVPIYTTRLTMALIEKKLEERNMLKTVKRKVVKFGQSINLGEFRIEFIKTNHSIQDAAALAIYSPAGVVVHTGDFKVDYTPVYGDAIDLQRFAELGKKGVLALMCDSTNAERPGFTMSEKTVGATFDRIFSENPHETRRTECQGLRQRDFRRGGNPSAECPASAAGASSGTGVRSAAGGDGYPADPGIDRV